MSGTQLDECMKIVEQLDYLLIKATQDVEKEDFSAASIGLCMMSDLLDKLKAAILGEEKNTEEES